MALQTLEELLSRSAALFQHEQTLENNRDIDSASASLLSSTATSPQRRCEERTDDQAGIFIWCSRYVRLLEGSPSSSGKEGLSWSIGARKEYFFSWLWRLTQSSSLKCASLSLDGVRP